MTAPRQVLPGTTYHVTRRCFDRQFFLKPDPLTNAMVGYILAVAAQRCGILIHVACVMSNHLHLLLTDPLARLPEFEQYLDGTLARAMNSILGRSGYFWDERRVSAIPITVSEESVAKAAYVLANPVTARLVRRGSEWPGLWSGVDAIGGEGLEFARPNRFFNPKGRMPKGASLRLTPPPGFTAAEFRDQVGAALEERERQAQAEAKASKTGFLGVERVLAQKPTDRPSTPARRGEPIPRVAGSDGQARREALAQLARFLDAYREARARFRAGMRDVVFPAGTYWMRVAHGVNCAPA